jgi:hypothetical protein
MKPRTILLCGLSLGLAAAFTLSSWPRHRSPEGPTPIPGKFAAPRALAACSPVPSTRGTLTAAPRRIADDPAASRFDDVQASVHLKLRQLFETKTDDLAGQDQLVKELTAVLTDDNTAVVVKSLSAEELDTPFGLAAFGRWLEVDVSRAADWIAARPDATEDHAWLVARKMLDDTTALHNYCDRLPDTGWKQDVLNGAGLAVLAQDPAEAIALAQRMEVGPARQNLLETVAYDWIGRAPRATLEWIASVEEPALRERLLAVGAKAIAAADPDLAVDWLGAAVKSDGLVNDTALVIAETWAAQNPAAAAGWVAQWSGRGPRASAIEIVSRRWLQADPGAAHVWIQTLPERDKVLVAVNSPPPESPEDPE